MDLSFIDKSYQRRWLVLRLFLIRDGKRASDSLVIRSILLQLKRDLDFMLCHFDKSIKLDKVATEALYDKRPIITPIILYCTAIDLLGVIAWNRPTNRIGLYFRKSAQDFFNHDEKTANLLWKMRNSLVHEYSHIKMRISPVGKVFTVVEEHQKGYISVYTENMRTNLAESINNFHSYVTDLPPREQQEVVNRIKLKGIVRTNAMPT